MFILKLFWNVLATFILLVVLALAGFGGYTLYNNKVNDNNDNASVKELVIENNTNNVL